MWSLPSRDPTEEEKRIMFREALRIGLSIVMHNHTYVLIAKLEGKGKEEL